MEHKDYQGSDHDEDLEQQAQSLKDFMQRKISQLSDIQLRYTYSNASSNSQFSMYEASSDRFQAKFVRDDQLYSQLMQKIAYLKTIIWIEDDDICLYIYYYYQWNEQKLTSSFFNDDWKLLKEKDHQYRLVNTLLSREDVCPVCQDYNIVYSSGLCHHSYCRSCWTSYIRAELTKGQICFPCMNEIPCKRSPILKRFIDLIAPQLSQLSRKKICINYAIQDSNICYCPSEKCPFFCVKPSMMQLQKVICPCGQIYCYRCRQESHQPATCSQVTRWNRIINSDQTNSSWITNHTKECPRCKQPIQKKVGCSHMRCLCQCQFCYECNGFWDQLHIAAKTQCPHRKSLVTKEKKMDRCTQLSTQLVDLIKQAQKHRQALVNCQQLVPDEVLKSRVIFLRTEVVSAWMTIKWTKICLCMSQLPEIEVQLEKEYIFSIRNVMEPIEIILKGYKNFALKELHYYGEQVLLRMQLLKKNQKIWQQAWQASH